KARVVIIGGGAAGAQAAKRLQRRFNVTLIDSKDHYEFTPSVLRTLADPCHLPKIQVKHSSYLTSPSCTLHVGRAARILKEGFVLTTDNKKFAYDYLVLAMGASYRHGQFHDPGRVFLSGTIYCNNLPSFIGS